MHPQQLAMNVRTLTLPAFEREIFKWISIHLATVLMNMQREQLFDESKGADGVLLGRYSRPKYKQVRRSINEPYDMVFTGALKASIRVSFKKDGIIFNAGAKYVNEVRFSDVFGTSDWFGLTEENMKILIDKYVRDRSIQLVRNKIFTGKWQ